MSLNDTAGQETYAGLRPITYFDMDVIVLCFDVSRPESLANVEELWTPELYNYAPDLPVILVACKTDLRHDPATHEVLGRVGMGPVTRKEGEAMAARIGARAYVECSAVWNVNVTDVFEAAAKAALDKAARRREGGRGFKRGFKRRLQEYRERCKIL
ncbi:GTP-binding protein Rho1 [Irineochytrium annulatum]|nr:GTP-binding protein Rho1 [Irineochytrium annulatum]